MWELAGALRGGVSTRYLYHLPNAQHVSLLIRLDPCYHRLADESCPVLGDSTSHFLDNLLTRNGGECYSHADSSQVQPFHDPESER